MPAMSARPMTPPTTPPAMAPAFTECECFSGVPVAELLEGFEDVVPVAVATRSCSREDSVASANPAEGTVDVAPPVALKSSCQLIWEVTRTYPCPA